MTREAQQQKDPASEKSAVVSLPPFNVGALLLGSYRCSDFLSGARCMLANMPTHSLLLSRPSLSRLCSLEAEFPLPPLGAKAIEPACMPAVHEHGQEAEKKVEGEQQSPDENRLETIVRLPFSVRSRASCVFLAGDLARASWL